MSKRLTSGIEWLSLSMASFNGSGYADKQSPEHYVASYKAYKTMKRDNYALEMLGCEPDMALNLAKRLVNANDAGRTPSKKAMAKFSKYYNPKRVGLFT